MIASGSINVNRGNVTFIVSGVPVRVCSVANPDHVVEAMVVHDSIVDKVPECLESSRSFGSPPKPTSFWLVQRAKEDGDPGVGKSLDLGSNCVDIAKK